MPYPVSSSAKPCWAASSDRVIDVHVSNLRKELGLDKEGERIKAVRGTGYLFVVRPGPTREPPRA